MKKLAFALSLISSLSAQTGMAYPEHYQVNTADFPDKLASVLAKAADDWNRYYQCRTAVKIKAFKARSRKVGNNRNETIIESAQPGLIHIDPRFSDQARNMVLHAMTHACKPSFPSILERPLPYSDGEIIGFTGAMIIIRLHSGQDTTFKLLEEGIAERNGSNFTGYNAYFRKYFALGKLARQHFPPNTDPVKLVEQNDGLGLIAAILHKERESITGSDIQRVMQVYQQAWDNN